MKAVVNVTVSYEVARDLERMAEKMGSTRSWIVEAALFEWLRKAKGEVPTAKPAASPSAVTEGGVPR